MHVRVNDVNEFSPVFVERRYEASVPEGRLFDRIVRVEALDADCSPQYSQICFYDIITPNVPFAIDNDGEICFIAQSNKSAGVGLSGLLILACLCYRNTTPATILLSSRAFCSRPVVGRINTFNVKCPISKRRMPSTHEKDLHQMLLGY